MFSTAHVCKAGKELDARFADLQTLQKRAIRQILTASLLGDRLPTYVASVIVSMTFGFA